MTALTQEQLEHLRPVIVKDIQSDAPIVIDVAQFLLSKMYNKNNNANNNAFDENTSNKLFVIGEDLAKSVPMPKRRGRLGNDQNNNNNNNKDDANGGVQAEEKEISWIVAVGAVATILVLNFDTSTSAADLERFSTDCVKFGKNDGKIILQAFLKSSINSSLEKIETDLNEAIATAIQKKNSFSNANNNNNNDDNNNNNGNLVTGDDKTNLEVVWKHYCDKLLVSSPYIKNRSLPPPTLISVFDAITARHDAKAFANESDFSEALKGIGVKVAADVSDAKSLARRFVRVGTGKLLQVPLQLISEPEKRRPSFEPSKNNVVIGVSGDGKTIVPFTQAATWNEADLVNTSAEKGFVVYAMADWNSYRDMFENLKDKDDRNKRAVKYLIGGVCCAFSGRNDLVFPCDNSGDVDSFVASLNQPQGNRVSIADALRSVCASSIPNSQLQTRCGLHRLYLALDEMGLCPLLVRGCCAVWDSVRAWLARYVFLMDPDKLFLVTIGTGVQRSFEHAASNENTFAVWSVNNRCLFREHLRTLASAVTTSHQGKQLIERFDNALFERVPDCALAADAVQDGSIFSSFPLLNKNSTDEHPVPFRIRVTDIDFIHYRFAQVVTFNARAATIAAACLDLAVLPDPGDQRPAQLYLHLVNDVRRTLEHRGKELRIVAQNCPARLHAALRDFTASVVSAFKELNGLRGTDAMVHIADALRVAMSRTSELDNAQHERLCTKYGLLRELSDKTFEICPAFAAMFLLTMNLNSSAEVGHGTPDMFELVVAEHHALVLFLRFPKNVNVNNKFITIFQDVPELAVAPVETLKDCLTDFRDGFKNFTTQSSAEFPDSWKSRISRSEAIVLVNGPHASFADVIVLTPGRIFLTQCKYYGPNSKCDAEGEFKKMHVDTNPKTMKLLIDCCKMKEKKVEVVCSIVFKFQDQNNLQKKSCTLTTSTTASAIYTRHFLYAFPFAEKDVKNRSWAESNMFPVLVAPFEP